MNGIGKFVVERHLEGGFWIGDGSGQYLRVVPQPGFEEDDLERCRNVAKLLTKQAKEKK